MFVTVAKNENEYENENENVCKKRVSEVRFVLKV